MRLFVVLALAMLVAGVGGRRAFAVTAAEAQALGRDLTPMGAERAGTADGSIPAWTGGYVTPTSGYRAGDPRPDPFAADKPLFSITAANLNAYASKLPEGAKVLFAKFPGYRMDVYPTRRSAAAPQAVYDAIAKNAVNARPVAEGLAYGVEGAVGGIPFPIPKSGMEVVWNHLLG